MSVHVHLPMRVLQSLHSSASASQYQCEPWILRAAWIVCACAELCRCACMPGCEPPTRLRVLVC
eukprot:6189278-Pleurochrysis_carterae.AAC.4